MTNSPSNKKSASKASTEVKVKKDFMGRPIKPKEFTKNELIGIFRGLGSMLRAQINTSDALKYYAQGLSDKTITDTLDKIREDIGAGVNVHEAFRRTERFNDTIIGLIQAGSDAGQLHEAFRALAARLVTELKFKKALKKATVQPGCIIAVLIGAFIVSQVKIVPQVEEMLAGVGAKPDGLTAISFNVSHFVQSVWHVFCLTLIGLGITIAKVSKVQSFIMGVAMSKGINLAKSIRVSANSVKGTPFYDELREAAGKYENAGVPLSTAFAKYTSVDSQITHMLSIGEKSASLDSQLEMLTLMYEEDADNYMAVFAATVSFVVLIIAVCIIAGVFIGTFLPIFLMGPKMMESGV